MEDDSLTTADNNSKEASDGSSNMATEDNSDMQFYSLEGAAPTVPTVPSKEKEATFVIPNGIKPAVETLFKPPFAEGEGKRLEGGGRKEGDGKRLEDTKVASPAKQTKPTDLYNSVCWSYRHFV